MTQASSMPEESHREVDSLRRRVRELEARLAALGDPASAPDRVGSPFGLFLEPASPLLGWMTGPDHGCTSVNAAYQGFTGRPLAECLGSGWADDLHPDDRGPALYLFAEAAEARAPFQIEFRLRRADGAYRWVQDRGTPRWAPDGTWLGYIGFALDITEQKQLEDALRRSEERFALMIETAADGIILVDRTGRITLANAAAGRILGRSRSEVIGVPWAADHWQITHPDGRPVAEEEGLDHRALGRGETTRNVERLVIRPDGTRVVIQISAAPLPGISGRPDAMVVTFVDITERIAAEQTLRESEARFRTLIEALDVGITLHGAAGETLLANPAGWRLLGLTEDELLGRSSRDPVWDIIHEDGSPFPLETFPVARALTTGRIVRDVVMGVARPDRPERVWLLVNAVPQLGPDGRVRQVICAFSDLTAHKQAEEERRRLEAKVQQAQKLESLGVLAGGIAHDFNNLLVGILGHAGLALMELPPEAMARASVRQIETAALRAAELTRQMLAYSGKGRFVIQPIDLSQVVEEMATLLQTVISKRVVLRFDFAANLPAVKADVTQIRQVVMNLITNASDAIGDHSGGVALRTGVLHADASYLASTHFPGPLPEGYYVYLEVADTGCGMDEATMAKIFDPFFSTKFTGRGLGLAAVLGIVRGHQGSIKVYSEPGRGTTFKVLFPSSELDRPAPPPRTTVEPAWRGSGTVLVADDEETVRAVARGVLEKAGFLVVTVPDGLAAIEMVRTRGAEFAIVLLDLTMPHLDGEAAFREIRLLRPGLRVVLMSGYNEQEVTDQFVGKGLAGFVQKPFRPNELLEQLQRILEVEDAPP